MDDVIKLINNLGFPIAVAIYLLYHLDRKFEHQRTLMDKEFQLTRKILSSHDNRLDELNNRTKSTEQNVKDILAMSGKRKIDKEEQNN